MPTSYALIPSYVLKGEKGQKIANLKGMDRGWLYPTFMIQYVRNPAPLFLFDRFYIDEEAARFALNFSWDMSDNISYESRAGRALKLLP